MLKIARTVREARAYLKENSQGKTVGFVPTMGDLHEGHLSLLRRSKKENDLTVISIFVNPKQFDRREDYERYMRNEENDLRKARDEEADLAFLPQEADLYPDGFQTWVKVEELSKGLCGKFRPGHFLGVATVVLKLFHIVEPNRAYFGMKDYQQLKIVEKMVKDLNLSLEIVPCPTVRENDGLALSSRNSRLSPAERQRAATIALGLRSASVLMQPSKTVNKKLLENRFKDQLKLAEGDKVEYFEAVDPQTLIPMVEVCQPALLACSVWIGGTRLIDNLLVPGPV